MSSAARNRVFAAAVVCAFWSGARTVWPDEMSGPQAKLTNRLYVAIARLRRLGLDPVVVRTTDGLLTGDYAKNVQRVVDEGDEALGIAPVTGGRIIVRQLMLGPVVDAPIGIRIFGPRRGA